MPLNELLQPNHPEVRLLSLRRISRILRRLIDQGARLPNNPLLPIWIDSRTLADLDELYQPQPDEPARVLLLAPPNDRGWYDEHAAVALFERLLFEARVASDPAAVGPEAHATWQQLHPHQRRELRAVLEHERRLPNQATDREVIHAASVLIAMLRQYQPEALPFYFPLLPLSHWPELPTAAQWRQRCSLPKPLPPTPSTLEHDQPDAELIEDCLARGNFARAALLARGQSPWLEQAIDQGLAERLGDILGWSTEQRADWSKCLAGLAKAAGGGRRLPEARALRQLQRIVSDLSTNLSEVAPVDWLASLGRRPLLRSLKPVRDFVLLRRLHAAFKQVIRSSLPHDDRHRFTELLETEIHRAESRARARFTPILSKLVLQAGLVPTNLPEQVACDKVVAELLDRLCETGFLRLADVRDAIARNQLKLPDLQISELFARDALLQLDRALAERLPGVYHRGEIYLRTFQRGSSLAFGTRLGRWLSLWLLLPFGGAYVIVEGVRHFGHAMDKLWHGVRQLSGIEPPLTHPDSPPHQASMPAETWLPVLLLGLFLLALINSGAVRRQVGHLLITSGRWLRRVLWDWPRAVWASPIVRWIMDNRVTRFISRYLLPPSAAATGVALAASVLIPDIRFALLGGAATFIIVGLLSLSRWGQQLREDVLEYLHDVQRRLLADLLPGIANWFIWAFRETLGWLERLLFTIDEWFRYRSGRGGNRLALKVLLGLIWFPIAYVLRFAFYLLLEPQVNPIKHFPVVTVAHKVLLPLIPSLADLFNTSLETAGLIISAIPGIFGFLAWELKENWKLYAANRPTHLPREIIGHHGEGMTRLLRPGFHSGTIPKLFRAAQRCFARPDLPANQNRLQRIEADFHHLHIAFASMVERNLFSFWSTLPEVQILKPTLERVHFGYQRVELVIATQTEPPLAIAFEHIDGEITASITQPGWLRSLTEATRTQLLESLRGFFALGASGVMTWRDWCDLWTTPMPEPTGHAELNPSVRL